MFKGREYPLVQLDKGFLCANAIVLNNPGKAGPGSCADSSLT